MSELKCEFDLDKVNLVLSETAQRSKRKVPESFQKMEHKNFIYVYIRLLEQRSNPSPPEQGLVPML